MNRLGIGVRTAGHLLLRCLVGKYGAVLWTAALALLVGAVAYLSLVSVNTGGGGAVQGTV